MRSRWSLSVFSGALMANEILVMTSSPWTSWGLPTEATASVPPSNRSTRCPTIFEVPMSRATPNSLLEVSPDSTEMIFSPSQMVAVNPFPADSRSSGRFLRAHGLNLVSSSPDSFKAWKIFSVVGLRSCMMSPEMVRCIFLTSGLTSTALSNPSAWNFRSPILLSLGTMTTTSSIITAWHASL